MGLFRIHIRPQGGTASVAETFNYCLKNNLLGMGWRVKNLANTLDWQEYYQEAKKHHTDLTRCKYIKDNIKKDDLVWTRDRKGNYYLAKVVSGWEYFTTEESREKDIDIGNVFKVEMKEVAIDEVPGKVVACFRANRTLQSINGKGTLEYSKFLWNKLTGTKSYEVDFSNFKNIFMMLDDKETEDIIFLYLQSLGWYVVPSSRACDTIHFEYFLINKNTQEKAVVQVKTGGTELNQQRYTSFKEKIFLFQSANLYTGVDTDNVISIQPNEILNFIETSLDWLPSNFVTKFNLVSMG